MRPGVRSSLFMGWLIYDVPFLIFDIITQVGNARLSFRSSLLKSAVFSPTSSVCIHKCLWPDAFSSLGLWVRGGYLLVMTMIIVGTPTNCMYLVFKYSLIDNICWTSSIIFLTRSLSSYLHDGANKWCGARGWNYKSAPLPLQIIPYLL